MGENVSPDKTAHRSESGKKTHSLTAGPATTYCFSTDHIRGNCPKWKKEREEAAVVTTV